MYQDNNIEILIDNNGKKSSSSRSKQINLNKILTASTKLN